jgi:hypothetical protein
MDRESGIFGSIFVIFKELKKNPKKNSKLVELHFKENRLKKFSTFLVKKTTTSFPKTSMGRVTSIISLPPK